MVAERHCWAVAASVDFTISFDAPDEEGWIDARVLEVPGALSQGRTREEARENVLDALQTVLTPDDDLAGQGWRHRRWRRRERGGGGVGRDLAAWPKMPPTRLASGGVGSCDVYTYVLRLDA